MITGIINVNKPADWTSHDCVAVLRKVLGMKKIGHTGTLDPMATGVLPLCVGTATRITEYLDLDFKTYECEMRLGLTSDTLDIWGTVREEKDMLGITGEQVREAFEPFKGLVTQIPPKYSALKVDGKKLYEYARAGQDVEIKPRTIFIKELEIKEIDLEQRKVTWKVECSKGTYIRSICRDVGDMLGCGAVMSALVRTRSGRFTLDQAMDIREIRELERPEAEKLLLAPDYPLTHFGKVVLKEKEARYFCNGGHVSLRDASVEREPFYQNREPHIPVRDEYKNAYNLYLRQGDEDLFLGVAFYSEKYKKLVADKVFYRG